MGKKILVISIIIIGIIALSLIFMGGSNKKKISEKDLRDLTEGNISLQEFYEKANKVGIDGRYEGIINLSENKDCNKNNFSMAFILVGKHESDMAPEIIDTLNDVKQRFSEEFHTSTGNLAYMDTSYPLVTMVTEIGNEGEIIKKFYETHPDNFDFISIYPISDTASYMYHNSLKNNIGGIGIPLRDVTENFDSKRLLGFNDMGDFLARSLSLDVDVSDTLINGLLHETGHQWCCYVGSSFGSRTKNLEVIQQGIHFYRGLDSPFNVSTPMGSDNWVPNGDGTYRREILGGINKYHPFQLYFMGLLPESEYSKKYSLYNGGIGKDFNGLNASFYKEVSINDIIEVEGERGCITLIERCNCSGDLNWDGIKNIEDLTILVNMLIDLGPEIKFPSNNFHCGDINRDYIIGFADLKLLSNDLIDNELSLNCSFNPYEDERWTGGNTLENTITLEHNDSYEV